MKKIINFSFIVLLLAISQFTMAQTVDDIINKHFEAMGGKEKLLSLNSIKMDGNLNTQGFDIFISITKLNNKGSRLDFELNGTSNYQIVTPDKGISYMPIQGMSSPTDMPEGQYKAGVIQLDIQSPFLNYAEKGNKVELIGTEKIDDDDHYKLLVTFNNGLTTTYYISAKTNLVDKTSAKRMVNGSEMDLDTKYSNYKQNKDGYWFAYSSTGVQGDIDFDIIETNIVVDESTFK